jgi:hypothetical protein
MNFCLLDLHVQLLREKEAEIQRMNASKAAGDQLTEQT